jgi:heterogeneous nuclear ribonucleoprotein F/H
MQSLSGPQGYGELMGQHGIPPGANMGGRAGVGPGGLHAPLQKRTGGGIQVGDHTGFLRMRGLPFSAAKEDIFKFFVSYNPIEESIVLTYRNDGRATGEAYVGFASAEDSKRAMDLHRKSMGSRYIELFISNKDEQGRALARFGNR